MLSAASIVIPIAAVAVGKGDALVAIPFGAAALGYIWCAVECSRALFPRGFATGLSGALLLNDARKYDDDVRQMEAAAATYFDHMRDQNQPTLEAAADQVKRAIKGLTTEIVATAVALVVTLLT